MRIWTVSDESTMLLRRATCVLAAPRRVPLLARACSSAAAAPRTLDTPFISDTIPLAEGVLGRVEELLAEPGQAVDEDEIVAVVETDKVSLDIRASHSGVISAVLVAVGDEVKEKQPIYVRATGD